MKTGLKDKNGREIKKGDYFFKDGKIGIVKFGEHDTSSDYYSSGAYGWYIDYGNKHTETLLYAKYLEVQTKSLAEKLLVQYYSNAG